MDNGNGKRRPLLALWELLVVVLVDILVYAMLSAGGQ